MLFIILNFLSLTFFLIYDLTFFGCCVNIEA